MRFGQARIGRKGAVILWGVGLGLAAPGGLTSEEALEQLKSFEPYARWAAVKALEAHHRPEVVLALTGTVRQDSDADVRMAAAEILEGFGEASASPALEGALRDGTPSVRIAAAKALGTLGAKTAVPLLCGMLRSDIPGAEEKVELVRVVERLGLPSAAPALRHVLRQLLSSPRLRDYRMAPLANATTQALGTLEVTEAVPEVAQLLATFPPILRAEGMLKALRGFKAPTLREVLAAWDRSKAGSQERNALTHGLMYLVGPNQGDDLVRIFADPAYSRDVKGMILNGVTSAPPDPRTVPLFITLVNGDDLGWARRAALGLGVDVRARPDSRAVQALGQALASSDPELVMHAEHGLSGGGRQVVPVAISLSLGAPPSVRRSLAKVLGALQISDAVPGLVRAARDEDAAVRIEALKGIGASFGARLPKFAKRDQFPAGAREDDHPLPAWKKTPEIASVLERAMGDGEAEVRAVAMQSLSRLADTPLVSLPTFTKALQDSDARVKFSAICALAVREDLEALPALQRLAGEDANQDIRKAAAHAIGLIQRAAHPVFTPRRRE